MPQKAAMRAGHGNNRTPAHIADNYENTLPRLFGGVEREGRYFVYAFILHLGIVLTAKVRKKKKNEA